MTASGSRTKILKSGQLWKTAGGRLEITMLGKTLVHFRIFKGDFKRTTASGLLNQVAFQLYLKRHKAVLVSD